MKGRNLARSVKLNVWDSGTCLRASGGVQGQNPGEGPWEALRFSTPRGETLSGNNLRMVITLFKVHH